MLNDDALDEYHRNGFVVPDFEVRDDVVQAIHARFDHLLARHPEFRDNCGALLRHDMGFAEYAHDPAILDMVARVIGPDLRFGT